MKCRDYFLCLISLIFTVRSVEIATLVMLLLLLFVMVGMIFIKINPKKQVLRTNLEDIEAELEYLLTHTASPADPYVCLPGTWPVRLLRSGRKWKKMTRHNRRHC